MRESVSLKVVLFIESVMGKLGILSREQFKLEALREACRLLEDFSEEEIDFYIQSRSIVRIPKRERADTSVKFKLFEFIERRMKEIPEGYRYCKHNAEIFGQRILIQDYFPDYGEF